MAQLFHQRSNLIAKVTIWGGVITFTVCGTAFWLLYRSSYLTERQMVKEQPVPFSHKHHVGGLGIDCRYCHTGVETSAFAGIPPTETCMSCHSQIWTNAEILEPVRESLRDNAPLRWNRVNDLPDYVYFNHGIHISKGIGCESCHGRIDQMPLVRRAQSLQMGWCLSCHRHPEQYIRPREQVFAMGYEPSGDRSGLAARLIKDYNVRALTDCYTCHR